MSPRNGQSPISGHSRTTQLQEPPSLVMKQEITQESISGLHQEAITPVVNQSIRFDGGRVFQIGKNSDS